jgi:signal transduction histidine kinase
MSRVSRWLPAWTVRLRLTLLYGGLVLLSGAALLGLTVLLATQVSGLHVVQPGLGVHPSPDLSPPETAHGPHPSASGRLMVDLHQLLMEAGIALAALAVASVAVGWLVAGRLLRPLRVMTATTRRISADDLHLRLDARGPGDELKDLSDTIDGLLVRLEAAFEAQRRFVANVSHELRTPLTLERALLEVALADPDADAASLRSTCQEVLDTGRHQERLIEALLTLARSQRGLDRREPLDLAAVAGNVLAARTPDAAGRRVRVRARLDPAPTSGDRRLVERLVVNLVDNALRHNLPAGGEIEVATGATAGHAVLRVSNTGPVVPPDQVDRLLQPFQRLTAGGTVERAGEHEGFGLGLSIVAAIAAAHGAHLTPTPRPRGGLSVQTTFPAAGPAPDLRGRWGDRAEGPATPNGLAVTPWRR